MSSKAVDVGAVLRDLRDGPRRLGEIVSLGNRAVPDLERFLRGPSESIDQPRSLCADALGMIGTPPAVDALLAALQDSTTRQLNPVLENAEDVVVNRIAENLADVGDPRAVGGLMKALAKRAYPACATALGRLRDPRAAALLVERLKSDVTREPAMEALRSFEPDRVRPLLVELLVSRPQEQGERLDHVWGRAAAATLLGQLGNSEPVLRVGTEDPRAEVRTAAALALAEAGPADAASLAVLLEALESPSWWQAAEAEEALIRQGDHAIPTLGRVVTERAPTRTARARRLRSIGVLGRMESAQAIALLEKLSTEPDTECRMHAVVALDRSARPEAIHALSQFARDRCVEIRHRVARALEARGEAALDGLVATHADPDSRIRRDVRLAIERAGGEALRKLRARNTWHARWLAWRCSRDEPTDPGPSGRARG